MNLRYITCSDPRNYNTFTELYELWNIDPRVEIAIQMHPGKVSPDTERYKWIQQLIDSLYIIPYKYNLAIHVNNEWCDSICKGVIPWALQRLFDSASYYVYRPLVQRIQLNIPQKTADNFDPQKLKNVIKAYDDKEFILQYNDKTKVAVDKLHQTGVKFSLLFDASGGRGLNPETWQPAIYPEKHPMGYSGGMGPENIAENLDKINSVATVEQIWIDAEGKLKTDDKFDFNRAKQYIKNALSWEQKQR